MAQETWGTQTDWENATKNDVSVVNDTFELKNAYLFTYGANFRKQYNGELYKSQSVTPVYETVLGDNHVAYNKGNGTHEVYSLDDFSLVFSDTAYINGDQALGSNYYLRGGYSDASVRAYDLNDGSHLYTFDDQDDFESDVKLSPNENYAMVGGPNNAFVYDMSDGTLLYTHNEDTQVQSVGMNTNRYIYGTDTGDVSVRDLSDGSEIHTHSKTNAITSADMNADYYGYTENNSGYVRIYLPDGTQQVTDSTYYGDDPRTFSLSSVKTNWYIFTDYNNTAVNSFDGTDYTIEYEYSGGNPDIQ